MKAFSWACGKLRAQHGSGEGLWKLRVCRAAWVTRGRKRADLTKRGSWEFTLGPTPGSGQLPAGSPPRVLSLGRASFVSRPLVGPALSCAPSSVQ